MKPIDEERTLWHAGAFTCVMVSCCTGAELQVRKGREGECDIVLRELYPAKSDLYDRARALLTEFAPGS